MMEQLLEFFKEKSKKNNDPSFSSLNVNHQWAPLELYSRENHNKVRIFFYIFCLWKKAKFLTCTPALDPPEALRRSTKQKRQQLFQEFSQFVTECF